jgi:hypothetical protein
MNMFLSHTDIIRYNNYTIKVAHVERSLIKSVKIYCLVRQKVDVNG